MQPSAQLCRAQESRQLALATQTTLANVRDVARGAAAAWAKEAVAAEKREERKARLDATRADAAAKLHLRFPPLDDRAFSENPDRGFADASPVRRLSAVAAD